jgi:DnaK suppressor protein
VAKGTAPAVAVRPGEEPWRADEIEALGDELRSEAVRLRAEIAATEQGIRDLLGGTADEGGEDTADSGSKAFEREHEMALAESHREILGQVERALRRLESGEYGICESCGQPIGKGRLSAFPRATMCVTCKQRQERR